VHSVSQPGMNGAVFLDQAMIDLPGSQVWQISKLEDGPASVPAWSHMLLRQRSKMALIGVCRKLFHILCRLSFAFQDLPPLTHHMCIEDVASRHIDEKHNHEQPIDPFALFCRWFECQIHEDAFAGDTNGIKNEESIVSEPSDGSRNSFTYCRFPHEESVSNDFCRPPRRQDTCERDWPKGRPRHRSSQAVCSGNNLWEHVQHHPHNQYSGGDLHCRSDRAGSHEADDCMDDLQQSNGLSPFEQGEECFE